MPEAASASGAGWAPARPATDASGAGVCLVGATWADVASDMRRRALDVAGPARDKIFRHVYSEPHPLMDEELAWLESYESGFEGGAA